MRRGRLAGESKGRYMKRLILGLVLAGLVALVIPAGASAVTYNVFVGCDETAEIPQPSHKCLTTDDMAAYFEASEGTEYEACLFHLGQEECSSPSVALAGTCISTRSRST